MLISDTVNKANRVLEIIKRTVGAANSKVFSMLYIALVWPIRCKPCILYLIKHNYKCFKWLKK